MCTHFISRYYLRIFVKKIRKIRRWCYKAFDFNVVTDDFYAHLRDKVSCLENLLRYIRIIIINLIIQMVMRKYLQAYEISVEDNVTSKQYKLS